MWRESPVLPIKMVFKAVLNDGVFPDYWKKSNTVHVY